MIAIAALSLGAAAVPAHGQDPPTQPDALGPSVGAPDPTAEQITEAARQSLKAPGTSQVCQAPKGNEIVVCAQPSAPGIEIPSTQDDRDREAAAAARTLCAGCVKRQGVGIRVGFGNPPPPPLLIDLKAIPEAPAGSDAARFKDAAEATAKAAAR
ncbi:MAG: hypothetical protein ABIT09_02350 [Croceibacterium sp.]